jgi:GH18 family chitinase
VEATSETIINNEASFRIAGYLPDYRFDGINLNATAKLLDDLYLFSLSPQTQLGPNMFRLCCLKDAHYEKARQAVAGTAIKLWVTVGGGGRSTKFTRNSGTMISTLKDLVKEQQLHGVDFDCEQFQTHQDYEDYYSLIKNAAYVLHKKGIQVSVALHAGQFLPKELYGKIDRINLMSYDMRGASYHADFLQARKAVDKLIDSGCDVSKIFLGIPAYGRHKRQTQTTKTFAELADAAIANGGNFEELRTKYEIDEYLVDSPAAVGAKVRYAKNEGLGGVFFWELGQDKQDESAPGGILLTAAAKAKGSSSSSSKSDSGNNITGEDTSEIYEEVKEEL